MISGCHSEETSADVSNVNSVSQLPNPAGRAGGACTSALLDILYGNAQDHRQELTFQHVLLQLRDNLESNGFEQVPQLTSSRPLEVENTPFHLVGGNGARRALLVGINYRGQNGELSGCHNDVFNMKTYLMNVHGFPESDITVLVDDTSHAYPTKRKIIASLESLVSRSVSGDSAYFHYSGHGGLLDPNSNFFKLNNSEHDETIYPLDHQRAGQIRDFSLFNRFVRPMAAGVTATCVMDCCHSGSVLDLPYSFRPTPGGMIERSQNFNTLSNLAFLYILAGGVLPTEFGDVSDHLGSVVGGNVDDYRGTGVESEMQEYLEDDDQQISEFNDYAQESDMSDNGSDMNRDPNVVMGVPVEGEDASCPIVVSGLLVGETGNDFVDNNSDEPLLVRGIPMEPQEVQDSDAEDFGVSEYDNTDYEEPQFEDNNVNKYDNDYFGDIGLGDENIRHDEPGLDCGCISDVISSILDDNEE